jgi:hypothetical protein
MTNPKSKPARKWHPVSSKGGAVAVKDAPAKSASSREVKEKMGFVDFLYILQRRDASREFFEARAAGVNLRHGSVQDDRIDLRVRTERRSVWFHVAI